MEAPYGGKENLPTFDPDCGGVIGRIVPGFSNV